MIKPNVRASFGRREAEMLVALAGSGGENRLREKGVDALLDEPAVVRRLLDQGGISHTPAPLVFYLLVRHALLQREIVDREIADYTAAVLLAFGRTSAGSDPDEIDPLRYAYLTDILAELERARGEREFALRVHLGNFALWLAGVFPDHVVARMRRRGAPSLSFYDDLGASGFRSAAGMELALRHGMGDLFLRTADQFRNVRAALNGLSEQLFFPRGGDPVERLLREAKDDFELRSGDA